MRDKRLSDDDYVAIASCVSHMEQLELGNQGDRDVKIKAFQALCDGIKSGAQSVTVSK